MQDEDQLSGEEREMELALRALRPTAARVNAAAAALEAGRRHAMLRMRAWVSVAAAVLLAAGGAWLAFGSRGPAPVIVKQRTPDATPLVLVTGASVEPPTALAYRRALGESVAALDDLLDRQAASDSATGGRAIPAVTVTTFSSDPFARSM